MAERKNYTAPLLLLFLFVVLPGVSWWYLNQGFEYRKEAIRTQGDYGQMPDLGAMTQVQGKLPATLRGSMIVVGWLDPTKEEPTALYGATLDSLYQQFKDSPNLHFSTIVLAEDPQETVAQFTTRYHLPQNEMLSFLRADERAFQASAENFNLPLSQYDAPGEEPIVALVDSSQTIVKHYNLARRDETVSLVELVSVIIPLPERRDIVVERGREL